MTQCQNVRLRSFRTKDLPAVQKLIFRTIDVSYAKTYSPSAMGHFRNHHADEEILGDAQQGYMVILEKCEEVIGTGTLINGKITRMYVAPENQGRGFGRQIVNLLEQHAKTQGLESIFLYSSVVAKPFYESLGYHIEAEKSAQMQDGEHLEYFEMTKHLEHSLPGPNG